MSRIASVSDESRRLTDAYRDLSSGILKCWAIQRCLRAQAEAAEFPSAGSDRQRLEMEVIWATIDIVEDELRKLWTESGRVDKALCEFAHRTLETRAVSTARMAE
jgi:hypothetical protein